MKKKPVPKPRPARVRRPAAGKLNLGVLLKAEYVAPREPVLLDTQPGCYLAVTGEGAPGGAVFQSRIGALYAVAFTVKMTRKFSGRRDYTIGRLEARYLNLGTEPMPPREQWRWQLLIRTPEFVTPAELQAAVVSLRRRGKEGDAARVTLETIAEGRCVQVLHVGPYDRVGEVIDRMAACAQAQGLKLDGPCHEIYISDPRRVAPDAIKTIIRLPVCVAA
jgi:hypothetical protein